MKYASPTLHLTRLYTGELKRAKNHHGDGVVKRDAEFRLQGGCKFCPPDIGTDYGNRAGPIRCEFTAQALYGSCIDLSKTKIVPDIQVPFGYALKTIIAKVLDKFFLNVCSVGR